MAFPADFMTFRQDLRPFGNGTVISYLPDTALVDLAEGELVGWNASVPGLQRWLQDGGGTNPQTQVFVGLSRDSQNTIASLGNQPALSNFLNVINRVGVWTTGIHLLQTKNGDSYTHGVGVYAFGNYTSGSGSQRQVTVTQPANGILVGAVYLPDGSTVIGDGTKRVAVLIDEFTLQQKVGVKSTG